MLDFMSVFYFYFVVGCLILMLVLILYYGCYVDVEFGFSC